MVVYVLRLLLTLLSFFVNNLVILDKDRKVSGRNVEILIQ